VAFYLLWNPISELCVSLHVCFLNLSSICPPFISINCLAHLTQRVMWAFAFTWHPLSSDEWHPFSVHLTCTYHVDVDIIGHNSDNTLRDDLS
jgi:hypothetical protein